ncbi:hypothetical protein EB061_10125 [bacterium]|jgi:hypothetical protein|nr:hypothetical protein [bacterium]
MIRFDSGRWILLIFLWPLLCAWIPVPPVTLGAPVLIRDSSFRPVISIETLEDLREADSFDGRHFRILLGKSEESLSLSGTDPALALKAGTVYHHLTRARRFWVERIGSDFVKQLPPVSVRLEITNGFSDLGHFQNDRIDPQFNNALSVPGGTPFAGSQNKPWNPEIWFRPMKRIRPRDLPDSAAARGASPIEPLAEALSGPLRVTQAGRLLQTALEAVFFPAPGTRYSSSFLRQGGTWIMSELALRGLKHFDPRLLQQEYYLDAAMIPEISYHEYSHIALSEFLPLHLSTPVLEGMADYFAARIGNHPVIAGGIGLYSSARPKNGNRRSPYNAAWEERANANADFVLSLLWSIHRELPDHADVLIFEAARRLANSRADIRHDLLRALLDACSTHCPTPARDRLGLRALFEERGF